MSLKGFNKGFTNSKVATHKVLVDTKHGGMGVGVFGKNKSMRTGMKSGTKGVKMNGK